MVLKHQQTHIGYLKNALSSAKHRARTYGRDCTLTVSDLEKQWEKQCGLCAVSGMKLTMEYGKHQNSQKNPTNASLDRTDNSKGYVPDNIQWVTNWIQNVKQDYDLEDVKTWIVLTAEYITKAT